MTMLPYTTLQFADEVLKRAIEEGVTIGCVESCTGGLLGAAITSIEGSSGAFLGSIVSYDNEVKVGCVGVSREVLDDRERGAVSAACAAQMAIGGLGRLGVDRCVSVTGIAGPKGGSKAKPVGTVWFGMAARDSDDVLVVRVFIHEPSTREGIRGCAVLGALTLLDPRYGGEAIEYEKERAVLALSEVMR